MWQFCVMEEGDSGLSGCNRAAGRAGESTEAGEIRELEHRRRCDRKKKKHFEGNCCPLYIVWLYDPGGVVMAHLHVKGEIIRATLLSQQLGSQSNSVSSTSGLCAGFDSYTTRLPRNTPLSSQPTSTKRPFLGSLDSGDFRIERKIAKFSKRLKKNLLQIPLLGPSLDIQVRQSG